METNEMLKIIDAVVQSNNLGVARNFNADYIGRQGFYSDVEDTACAAIERILELCRRGVNNGFGKDLRNDVEGLSKLVVDLANVHSDDVKRKNKLKGQVQEYMGEKSDNKQNDPRITIAMYVDTTIRAVDTILRNESMFGERVKSEMRQNLELLKQRLEELKTRTDAVIDTSSTKALEYFNGIVEQLLEVRRQLLNTFCSRREVSNVERAVNYVIQWSQLTGEVSRKERAKESFSTYVDGGINALANAGTALDDFSAFAERVHGEKKALYNSMQPDVDRLTQYEKELEEVNKQINDLLQEEANNGRTAGLEIRAEQLIGEKHSLQAEIEELRNRVRYDREINKRKREIIEQFEALVIRPLEKEIRVNPSNAAKIIAHMQMGSIVGLVSGNYNEQNLKQAQRALVEATNKAAREENDINNSLNVLRMTMNTANERNNELRVTLDEEKPQSIHAGIQSETSGLSALDLLRQEQEKESGKRQTTPQQNTNRHTSDGSGSIPLTDDDK